MTLKQLKYTIALSDNELKQIIQLQQKNLIASISNKEKEQEGFVTVQHDFDILKKMNDHQPHIIAKDGTKVIGYTLSMTKNFGNDIAVLRSMFQKIEKHLNSDTTYIVMGQVCIDKTYRGQGIFRGLYQKMKIELREKYDMLITEVAADNLRSLNAHKAIGFKTLIIYKSEEIAWHLIYWDWS